MRIFFIILLTMLPHLALAEDIYQQPEEFIKESFSGTPPKPQILKFPEDIRPQINKIMEHNYPVSQAKYWLKGKRSVWILEEIGKVKPITTGIIINDGKIEFLKVLIYRESHGWQVRYDFFTDQFKGAKLKAKTKLNKYIDNISGATMSVDALRNLSKLALLLHKQVAQTADEKQ